MKKSHTVIPVMLLTLFVAGCNSSSNTTPSDTTPSTGTSTSTSTQTWEGKTNEDFEYAKTTYTDLSGL